MKQFIGGLWGPAEDKNDSWVIYIDNNDQLTFEIDGGRGLKDVDNTILKVNFSKYYDVWTHLAAVFDGPKQQIYIYLNGLVVDSARNALYPVSNLHKISNSNLGIQLGACNGLSDYSSNRTFKGQMDEFRLWTRILTPLQINCYKDLSLEGNEAGLLIYYRFNQTPVNYDICDATANRNNGVARSGAACLPCNDRVIKQSFIMSPAYPGYNQIYIRDTLKCTDTKSWDIYFTDSSACGQYIYYSIWDNPIRNQKNKVFTFNPTYLNLQPLIPTKLTITFKDSFIGNDTSRLYIGPGNRCGGYNMSGTWLYVLLTRITELNISKKNINWDTVNVKCQNIPYIDSVFKICNQTNTFSTPRAVTINSITTKKPNEFAILNAGFPKVLQPGECLDVIVRFFPSDTTYSHIDTIRVVSDDNCIGGSGIIPLRAVSREVLMITGRGGTNRIDSVDFKSVCLNMASDALEYYWFTPSSKDIIVDSIHVPKHFISKKMVFPFILKPKTAYQPNYFRFLPTAQGTFKDSIIFYVRANGCTMQKKVYVSGRGFYANLKFDVDSVDFGTVVVGNEKTVNVKVTNLSTDTLSVSLYLKKGLVYSLTGARRITLRQNESGTFPILFKPYEDLTYLDEVCLFETKCFTASCIPIRGKGIYTRFSYDPPLMKTENVIACGSELDTLTIKNITSGALTIKDLALTPIGKYTLFSPPAFPATIDLNANATTSFIFRYTPNDVTQDRTDKAFLSYKTLDNIEWKVELLGTSLLPKIYVDDLKIYGTLEVGDKKLDTITVENSSPYNMVLDSIRSTPGFNILYPTKTDNISLVPRDTINVIVEFAPTAVASYNGKIQVYSSNPCTISSYGDLEGKGVIIKLEVPNKLVSYGFVKPCECKERQVILINQSNVFDMQIDSLWFDAKGIVNGTPQFYSWKSFYSPKGALPYKIPPKSFDTVYVDYCPKNISRPNLVDNNARMNIKASGSGWSDSFETFMVGKMMLMSMSSPDSILFPPTRVDTFSVPRFAYHFTPNMSFSPERVPIKIDSITFLPNDRVFFATDSANRPFPIYVDSLNKLIIKTDFKPRAVRNYSARMVIHISEPCIYQDTTIYVQGSSFAPAFGLSLSFDTRSNRKDTFKFNTCDTIIIPVYSSREIPATWFDIQMRLGYDTTKLAFIKAISDYTANPCPPYKSSISWQSSPNIGTDVTLTGVCNQDSTKPLFYSYFLSKLQKRDLINISADSVFFDTPDVILYHLISENGYSRIKLLQPEMIVLNNINYDSVKVLDCKYDTIRIKNIGDLPIKLNQLQNLHNDYIIDSYVPTLGSDIAIGDTATIIVKFCPRKPEDINQNGFIFSEFPCSLVDSSNIKGIGYAPKFPITFDLSSNFTIPDSISAKIGDTITFPIKLDKDIALMLNGKYRFVEQLKFKLGLSYNPFALKYLDSKVLLQGKSNFIKANGNLKWEFSGIDSLKAGDLVSLKFLVVVPDIEQSMINISSQDFDADSILFIDIIPQNNGGLLITNPSCNLTTLKIDAAQYFISQNYPNPTDGSTTIDFYLPEKSTVSLILFDTEGKKVKDLVPLKEMEKGYYIINFDTKDLVSGNYFYIIESGKYKNVKQMNILK
jgi:hypothetical protein